MAKCEDINDISQDFTQMLLNNVLTKRRHSCPHFPALEWSKPGTSTIVQDCLSTSLPGNDINKSPLKPDTFNHKAYTCY